LVTNIRTTSAPLPQLEVSLDWSYYYLGVGIGEAGLIIGNFDDDKDMEIFIGSYSSWSTTTLNIIKRNAFSYQVIGLKRKGLCHFREIGKEVKTIFFAKFSFS
jgi:hypothetical protein